LGIVFLDFLVRHQCRNPSDVLEAIARHGDRLSTKDQNITLASVVESVFPDRIFGNRLQSRIRIGKLPLSPPTASLLVEE
jgi:hypothetical protein